ncbi:hypothetical protein SUDANB58_04871 [Streptomyces sp. enrichment culture]
MMIDDSVLDDPVGKSLGGPHAHLARRLGGAATCCADVATFSAVPVQPGARDWADLAALLGPGAFADMFSCPAGPPPDREPVFSLAGRQLIWSGGPLPDRRGAEPDSDMVVLGKDDVHEMLDLVTRTEPGPSWSRTQELGTYPGVRVDGVLVAMAGERLRPPGWTEISAVCTAPEARAKTTPPAWYVRSPHASWRAASVLSCTSPRRTPASSRRTSASASRHARR